VRYPCRLPRPACFKPQPKVDGLFQEKLEFPVCTYSSLHPFSLPRLRVNWRDYRFGRYKKLSPHSPLLTLAHPPRSLSPTTVRSTNRLTMRGSILAPGQRGRNGLPQRRHFLAVAQNEGKATLKMTLKLALSPSPPMVVMWIPPLA